MEPREWEALVADNEDRLYRAALAILRDPGEAEDAVQDAFLKLLERRPAFESPEHRRNWLMKVTVNGCKTRLRAPWRRPSPAPRASRPGLRTQREVFP